MTPPPGESEFTQAAPYGQACDNCSRAKVKCMRRPLGQPDGPCERCHRRGRDSECSSKPRPRQKQRRKPGTSRTAHLEAKLDNLVSLLQSSHQSAHPVPATVSSTSRATTGTPSLSGDGDEPTRSSNNVTLATPAASPCPPAVPAGWPVEVSDEEADECLEQFCSKLHQFPFISLSPSETAATLRNDRPILWQTILAVSTKSLSRRQALGLHLRSLFAEKLVVQHERSLDLLLGLLAYMGWANLQMGAQQLFLCMYCHLLTALVQDLGLDQASKKSGESHPMACIKPRGLAMRLAFPVASSMEARRAAVATYVIVSEIVSFRAFAFQQFITNLEWTAQMEEHLHVLQAVQEAPMDAALVHMAQLKLIGKANEAARSIHAHPPQPSDRLRGLQMFQANSLQLRLDKLIKEAGALLDSDAILRLHTINTELEIHEVSLYQMRSVASSAAPDMERVAMLSRCVQAVRAWFDVFFGLEPATYVMFGFSIWAQLSHVVISLYRLTLLEEPWWDKDMVRRTIDLSQVLDEMLARVAGPSQPAGAEDVLENKDAMFYLVKSIKTIKAAWGPLLAPKPTANATTSAKDFDMGGSGGTSAAMPELVPGLIDVDLDGWMDMFTMAWVHGDMPGPDDMYV